MLLWLLLGSRTISLAMSSFMARLIGRSWFEEASFAADPSKECW